MLSEQRLCEKRRAKEDRRVEVRKVRRRNPETGAYQRVLAEDGRRAARAAALVQAYQPPVASEPRKGWGGRVADLLFRRRA